MTILRPCEHVGRGRRSSSRAAAGLLLWATWLNAAAAGGLPLLSEVYYDAVGSDDGEVFVEISGTPGDSLAGYRLEGVNGSDGSITTTLDLLGAIGADGLFVVADVLSGGGSSVLQADLLLDFDFQNGPDSIVLRDGQGSVVDAVGYGSFGPGQFFAGFGAPAADAPAGSSLARLSPFTDTRDNASDFAVLAMPTPGSVPELGTAAGLAMGGAWLARVSRRRRA